jgi:hypothetical protein
LKSTDADFPLSAIEQAGYGAVWQGQKTWNGVAILARNAEPVLVRTALPGDPSDQETRYIEAAINGIIVTSLYLPNGNPQPGPKFDFKLAWFKRLQRHAAKFLKQDIPVVLAGDYNVAPATLDIYPTKSWDNDALIQPKSRAAFKALVAQGWTDAIRELHPLDADVHVLGLQAKPLAARCRIAAGSFAAEPRTCAAPDQGRRRSQAPRRTRRQRPRPGLDRVEVVLAMTPSSSLRAQRSNPSSSKKARMDCFVASAPRNDGRYDSAISPRVFARGALAPSRTIWPQCIFILRDAAQVRGSSG